jgi:uncharacterized protein
MIIIDNQSLALSPKELEIVRGILAKHIPDYEVCVFGSRVHGTQKPYSDLDLAVIGDEPLSIMKLADVLNDFSESDLPFKVDIVDWATTSETFREIINSYNVDIQSAV